MKVLLTTSGTGSRLSSLTKYKNKSLIRVGEMPTISHIIKMYPNDTEFVITLGYLGHLVRQYIEIAHQDTNVTFVDVDKYEGAGSSLLYSMFCAKEHLDKTPFIFHACDTIAEISDFFRLTLFHLKICAKFGKFYRFKMHISLWFWKR